MDEILYTDVVTCNIRGGGESLYPTKTVWSGKNVNMLEKLKKVY